ncbi:MAG: hypothetical protein AMXMBFR44_4210 [Candidatus Campbellbacteria bacterium]
MDTKGVEERAQLFLIQKEDGRRMISGLDALGSEQLLFAVLVIKYSDGTGVVRFPRSAEKPFSVDLKGMTAEEFARKLLADEETEYGIPRIV